MCYGKWHTIYSRFTRWSENGLFWFLGYQVQQKKKITGDISGVDSTTIGIHRPGSGTLKKTDFNPGVEVEQELAPRFT